MATGDEDAVRCSSLSSPSSASLLALPFTPASITLAVPPPPMPPPRSASQTARTSCAISIRARLTLPPADPSPATAPEACRRTGGDGGVDGPSDRKRGGFGALGSATTARTGGVVATGEVDMGEGGDGGARGRPPPPRPPPRRPPGFPLLPVPLPPPDDSRRYGCRPWGADMLRQPSGVGAGRIGHALDVAEGQCRLPLSGTGKVLGPLLTDTSM